MRSDLRSGLSAAAGAFVMWGFLPLYWKRLAEIPAFEILCQRVLWSCLFVLCLGWARGALAPIRALLWNWRVLGLFACSSLILAGNWLLFIWAVNHDRVLETSLGYYINPLLSICLGVLLFRDRPRRLQWLAIALAAFGVLVPMALLGAVPLVALGLGVSFAIYGALRKIAPMESLPGLILETMTLLPLAVGCLIWRERMGTGVFLHASLGMQAAVALSGIVTTAPLVCFAYSARRLSLVTLGLMQYVSPSISFLLGVFLFQEPFTLAHAISFGSIWTALAIYAADGAWTYRRRPGAR